MDFKQNPDGSLSFYSDLEGKDLGKTGGPKTPIGGQSATGTYRLGTVAKIPFATVTSNTAKTAGVGNLVLDANNDVIVYNAQIYVTTTSPVTSVGIGVATALGVSAASNNILGNFSPATLGIIDATKTAVYVSAGSAIAIESVNTVGTLAGFAAIHYFTV